MKKTISIASLYKLYLKRLFAMSSKWAFVYLEWVAGLLVSRPSR